MDIWTLTVFIAVFDESSISTASRKVGRTQPQVSRIIKDLEAEVGFDLFQRTGQRLTPTARGLELSQYARDLLEQMSRLQAEVRRLRSGDRRSLHVIAPSYAFHAFVPRILAHLRGTMPDTVFRVSIPQRSDRRAMNFNGKFDCGVSLLPSGLESSQEHQLATIAPALLVGRGHPLGKLKSAEPKDLEDVDFVSLQPGNAFRGVMDEVFRIANISPKVVAVAPDMVAALRLIMEGLGVGVGDPMAAKIMAPGEIITIPFPSIAPTTFGSFFHAGSVDDMLIRHFNEAARVALRESDGRFVNVVE